MKLDEQRDWYEGWHDADKVPYPVEMMKQQSRIDVIAMMLQQIDFHTALVIGCGQGRELAILKETELVAFDLSFTAVKKAQDFFPDKGYVQADGMRLPFTDNSFDLVLSSEVIEHILEPERFVQEIARVLKPGGYLLLTTPNWNSFFGLARWLGEKILRRPITSDEQPVDNWFTLTNLKQLCQTANLHSAHEAGAWYFPPTGIGHRRLPDSFMAKVFGYMMPVERWLQTSLPGWGHMLVLITCLENQKCKT